MKEKRRSKRMSLKEFLGTRWMSLFITSLLLFGVLVGCGAANEQEANQTQNENAAVTIENEAVENQETDNEKEQEEGFHVSIVDSTGEEIVLTKKPERIVSLAPSTTEILYFLGAEDRIVGRTDYCTFPETIEKVQSVGTTSSPNVETVLSLEPDLVVASTHVSEEVIGKLRELGMSVAFLNEQKNFEGTYSAIENIGKLIGEEEKATEVITTMKEKVEKVSQSAKAFNQEEKIKVYYVVSFGEADYTAGGDTFIGEILTLAGGENIAKNIEGWSITKEQIAENEPDIIIAGTGMNIEDMKNMDFYKDLKAVQEGKIYEVDNDQIVRQAPRVADALIAVHDIIKENQK